MKEGFEHPGDLVCEIASGDKDECTRTNYLGVRLEFVDEGKQVGEGLARSSFVTYYHILTLHYQWNRLLLHWRRAVSYTHLDVYKRQVP